MAVPLAVGLVAYVGLAAVAISVDAPPGHRARAGYVLCLVTLAAIAGVLIGLGLAEEYGP